MIDNNANGNQEDAGADATNEDNEDNDADLKVLMILMTGVALIMKRRRGRQSGSAVSHFQA